ncbi:MAG: hypothetical protein V4553_04720 [Bacteroidota bacterium]
MRVLGYLSLFFFIFSCKSTDKEATNVVVAGTTDCDTANWYKDPKDRDSVLVYEDEDSKAFYKKGELKRILKSYPELDDKENILPPDQAYAKRGLKGALKPCDINLEGCELCQDSYYVLYAHFLKQRNGDEKYKKVRNNLIEIYRDINNIFGKLAQGGTYFSHQDSRILGYAEYSISLKKSDRYDDWFGKKYDISRQKTLYINSLRQKITDELNSNFDINKEDKPKLKKELFETVNQLDGLITNYFYLKMTQEFQYSNY